MSLAMFRALGVPPFIHPLMVACFPSKASAICFCVSLPYSFSRASIRALKMALVAMVVLPVYF
ncbi:hypothetical protein D3C85_1767720 [compost metagenome]